jgi:hypothetical protein
LLIGVPQMTVPTFVPGQPSQIPEIPVAKKTDQQGVSKIAVFAYNRVTGQRLWQSGTVEAISTARDTWVLGAGPFRKGTILHGTEFAGEQIPVPTLGVREDHDAGMHLPVVPVTASAIWPEPPMSRAAWTSLLVPVPGGSLTSALNVLVQSALARPVQARASGHDASLFGVAGSPSAKQENASSPPAAASLGSRAPSPRPANAGGQDETEPPRVLSSGWGFQSDGDPGLPTAVDRPMKGKDGSEREGRATAAVRFASH